MKYLATFALAALFTANSFAASVILSDSATDPTDALDITIDQGQVGTFYVWVQLDPAQTINGLGLDILSDNAIITATDFSIDETAALTGPRWNGTNAGTLGSSPLVDNSNSAAVTAVGLNQVFIGAGFQNGTTFGTDTVLHGTVTFSADAAGVTNVTGAIGDALISDVGTGVIDPSFVGGTITVQGSQPAIPEPTSAALLALGLAGVAARRRS